MQKQSEVSGTERGIAGCLVNHGSEKLPLPLRRMVDHAPESFEDLRYGRIAQALGRLWRDGKEATLMAIRKALVDDDQPDLGALVLQLMAEDLPVDCASGDAESLWPHYQQRRFMTVLGDAMEAGKSNPASISSVARHAQVALAEIGDEAQGSGGLPPIIDAADFLAEPIPEPPVLIGRILHQGSKLCFSGSSKSFKTWCLLDVAVSVASGKPWLGFATCRAKVLFVNFEIQPHPWQQRVKAVCAAKGITQERGWFKTWNLRGKAGDYRTLIPKIIADARREKFGLIVLDPVYKLYGKTDENAAGDVAELLNALEGLATETGAAVAFGAHFAKGNASGKEAIDRVSGSGVFARDPDSLLVFTKHREDNAFAVEPILRNFAPVAPFTVRWESPLMRRAEDLDPAKLKQAGGRKPIHSAKDVLSLLPEAGAACKAWREAAEGKGISKPTFYRLQKELATAGQVQKSADGTAWLRSQA